MAKSSPRRKKAKTKKAKTHKAKAKPSRTQGKSAPTARKAARKISQSDVPDNMLSLLYALFALKTGGRGEKISQSDVPDTLLALLTALAAIHRLAQFTQSDVPDNRLALLAALHAAYPGVGVSADDPEFALLSVTLDNAIAAMPDDPVAFRALAKIAQSDVPDNMLSLLAALGDLAP